MLRLEGVTDSEYGPLTNVSCFLFSNFERTQKRFLQCAFLFFEAPSCCPSRMEIRHDKSEFSHEELKEMYIYNIETKAVTQGIIGKFCFQRYSKYQLYNHT